MPVRASHDSLIGLPEIARKFLDFGEGRDETSEIKVEGKKSFRPDSSKLYQFGEPLGAGRASSLQRRMPPDLKGRQFFAIKGQQSWRAGADTPLAESYSSVGEDYKAFTSEPEYWENQGAGGVNVAGLIKRS